MAALVQLIDMAMSQPIAESCRLDVVSKIAIVMSHECFAMNGSIIENKLSWREGASQTSILAL